MGTLIKLKDYYVCNICCDDIVSFDIIADIVAAERNVFSKKPKGKSIEITDPEFAGFYPYEKHKDSKYRTNYKLLGRDGKGAGSIMASDYTKSKLISYTGPKYLGYWRMKDYVETVSIAESDLTFHNS